MKDLSEARRIVEQQRGEIERLKQEVTMLRQEYAADTVEIAKLSAMLDEQRQDLSDARSGWERSAESLREADEAMEKLQSELADMRFIRGIDARFCGRLALILECAILDPHGHFELACQLLEEYKAEWDKVNPSPPTFMGEPMPPERRARLLEMKAKRNVPANP
jgi:DNA repair exonuclease SbcCD ATPase subunit